MFGLICDYQHALLQKIVAHSVYFLFRIDRIYFLFRIDRIYVYFAGGRGIVSKFDFRLL